MVRARYKATGRKSGKSATRAQNPYHMVVTRKKVRCRPIYSISVPECPQNVQSQEDISSRPAPAGRSQGLAHDLLQIMVVAGRPRASRGVARAARARRGDAPAGRRPRRVRDPRGDVAPAPAPPRACARVRVYILLDTEIFGLFQKYFTSTRSEFLTGRVKRTRETPKGVSRPQSKHGYYGPRNTTLWRHTTLGNSHLQKWGHDKFQIWGARLLRCARIDDLPFPNV